MARRRGWFGRWLARVAERLARRYYEGPDPPRRLGQEVAVFAALHPGAGAAEWREFAARHGQECYRSGYVRGVERSVRDLGRVVEPALLEAAEAGHETSWVDLAPSEGEVQAALDRRRSELERLSPEDRLMYMDQIGRAMGGFRVQLLPVEPMRRKR